MSDIKNSVRLWIVCMLSVFVSLKIFFLNFELPSNFSAGHIEWYLNFSKNIYQPNTEYYAESILLPLLANFLGANNSLTAYKIFCAIITLSIIPIITITHYFTSKSMVKSLILMVFFSMSFSYLRHYTLGFPDPLTILLIALAALTQTKTQIFLFVMLAGLSHFSLAVFSAIGLCLISVSKPATKPEKWNTLKIIISALITSKLLLIIWYTTFHYNLISRVDWVKNKGVDFFIERYTNDPLVFFTTPGALFLASTLLILLGLALQKKYITSFCFLVSVATAYMAMFITVDGSRIFFVSITGAYISTLTLLVDGFSFNKIKRN